MGSRKIKFTVDPAHRAIDIFAQEITQHVWEEKYKWGEEEHPYASMVRVCGGVYKNDTAAHRNDAIEAMTSGLWVPGGRIHAGAGTDKVVTLLNCYVDQTIDDSMEGIANALKDAMLTQQQGGGIGMDFSTLRPSGAYLTRTGAVASGPLPFMDMWDAMCQTIMSAGSRRGAMMATMSDDHPDLIEFIKAKTEKGRLTNFNVSILVSDALMDAIVSDEEWYLGFNVPRADKLHYGIVPKRDGDWYVYQVIKARDLWNMITEHTYEYSEPGVIFIDRVNDQNNLNYLEDIRCTNPCGEQPLPPNGACNLGAVNLSRMVKHPFTAAAEFDYDLLRKIVKVGVRFLDNVIDVANYPLEEQKQEEIDKRRIGLGITGLGNALAELNIRYGTDEALHMTKSIMQELKVTAYDASADLAEERESFPVYHPDNWGNTPVVQSLPSPLQDKIAKKGIRNGVLLTIAPTGTTSLYMGNCSSGLEPVFQLITQRKVRQSDGEWKEFEVYDYGYNLWSGVTGGMEPLPDSLITHEDLTVNDHVRMQAVCQENIDASVSKTINCPEDMTYEEFQLVYWDAYKLGCKGCTTYRPSETRGSIFVTDKGVPMQRAPTRPKSLTGTTYKIRWPNAEATYYITINEHEGKPFEMFISSTSAKYSDWTTALSLMVSAIMKQGIDIAFVPEELMKVTSHNDFGWIDGKMYGSLVALIGDTIRCHLNGGESSKVERQPDFGIPHTTIASVAPNAPPVELKARVLGDQKGITVGWEEARGEICPVCNVPAYVAQEGCQTCMSCGFSNCG